MHPLCLLFEEPDVSKMLIQTVNKDVGVDYSGTCGQNSKIFTELRYNLTVRGKVEQEIYSKYA